MQYISRVKTHAHHPVRMLDLPMVIKRQKTLGLWTRVTWCSYCYGRIPNRINLMEEGFLLARSSEDITSSGKESMASRVTVSLAAVTYSKVDSHPYGLRLREWEWAITLKDLP